MIRFIDQLTPSELNGKKVFLRVDFNVPLQDGVIREDYRITKTKPTLDFLLNAGARVALVAHLAGDTSFESIAPRIEQLLGRPLFFTDVVGAEAATLLEEHECILLDNIRFHEGEEKNDKHFAQKIAEGFDLYVNDAFGSVHRAHASLFAVAESLPSYAGLLIRDELEYLGRFLDAPREGKTLILGGAKAKTKLPVVKNFIDRAEHILIGGVLANVLLAQQGVAVGRSLTEEVVADFELSSVTQPLDFTVSKDRNNEIDSFTLQRGEVIADDVMILDIGPMTIEHYLEVIQKSSLIVWNGPMGLSEVPTFARGTQAIAEALLHVPTSIVGGGDTLASVHSLIPNFSFVSTGGGAMLAFLSGEELPALKVLGL